MITMKTASADLFNRIETSRNLPTLPHILLKLIKACHKETATTREISQIISKDASLSAKLLRLVNSAYYGLANRVTSIEQALALLGTNTVQNVAVSASVYQAFHKAEEGSDFKLKLFWRQSLICATLARLIAGKASYTAPEEAFLSGLLHDVGKLVLWVNFPGEYGEILKSYRDNPDLLLARETRLGATHCEVGAWVIARWNLPSFMADAVLYHHDPVHRILDALPLVKIVSVASTLCSDPGKDNGARFKIAEEVFGFSRQETEELLLLAEEQTKQVAESLEIDIDAPEVSGDAPSGDDAAKEKELIRVVRDISLFQGTLQALLEAHDEDSILNALKRGIQILFDIKKMAFFLYDREQDVLVGKGGTGSGKDALIRELEIAVQSGKCLLSESLSRRTPLDTFGVLAEIDPSIIDAQLTRLLGKEGLLCLPMHARKEPVGVICLGLDRARLSGLQAEMNLLHMCTIQAALALDAEETRRRQTRLIRSERLSASSAVARKLAHEVNNPLSIIKNYLKILGLKLGEGSPAQEEIEIINEEIDRVSVIVRQLSDFTEPKVEPRELVDVNALITDLIRITHESFLLESGVRALLSLEPSLPLLMSDKNSLKQVLINLIKNAVEAMPGGGNLNISTRSLSFETDKIPEIDIRKGKSLVEITVSDEGPGIPEDIGAALFEPFTSTKGSGHVGLGLSIADSIIRQLSGVLSYETEEGVGTTFRIVLPRD